MADEKKPPDPNEFGKILEFQRPTSEKKQVEQKPDAAVSLEFSGQSAVRLAQITKKAGCASRGDTVRQALRLLEWMLEKQEAGWRIAAVNDTHMVEVELDCAPKPKG
jgi:hypothetical protein